MRRGIGFLLLQGLGARALGGVQTHAGGLMLGDRATRGAGETR